MILWTIRFGSNCLLWRIILVISFKYKLFDVSFFKVIILGEYNVEGIESREVTNGTREKARQMSGG